MSNHLPPAHILVFDSGLGGLSITSAIRQELPQASISYVADNARFPYGLLPEAQLIARVNELISTKQKTLNADIVVIACNTASTAVLPSLRQTLDVPVVGVVPAIKPAAIQTKTGHIGLLATPATVSRAYTDQLINDFAAQQTVHRIGSAELVNIAENPVENDTKLQQIEKELKPWLSAPLHQQIDTVVLGCTHFPLIKKSLQTVLGQHIALIDSGEAVAKQTAKRLIEREISHNSTFSDVFYCSKPLTEQQHLRVNQFNFHTVEAL